MFTSEKVQSLKGKVILITGGTGTVGFQLVRDLHAYDAQEIIIFSRNEVAQVKMKQIYNFPNVRYVIGDIRDEAAVDQVTRGVDYIFHLAALKHVGICEKQPMEAVKSNIIGSMNIVNYAMRNKVKKVVNLSTDKAVNPSNLYGHTKAVVEKFFSGAMEYFDYVGNDCTEFINVRSGNIFGSSGSVVPLFVDQVRKENKITITDGNMTRFFISVADISKLLITVMEYVKPGAIVIPPDIKAFRLKDLAVVIKQVEGNDNTEIVERGAGPGEKVHEMLALATEYVITIGYPGKPEPKLSLGSSGEYVLTENELISWIHDNAGC